jgi:tape measure domain-containing protein
VAESLGKVDLTIDVDSRAALAGLEQVRRSAIGTGSEIQAAFAAVNVAIAASAFTAIAKQISDVGIAAESANVRLTSLAGRFGETELAQQAVAAAAKQLNLSQTEAASGFAQLFASLRPTGVSLQQIETIFVGVTAAAKNTGLGAESVNNALIQLTQGLASGRLQGDELRSVLEQLPPLSQAIARELNVPVGSLKQLGSEGKITTDIIIRALERLKATELGALDKSLNTSAETLKRFSIAVELLQREVSTLFGKETLDGVKLVTGGVSDLATLIKAAARGAKELKDNLPKQIQQDQSIRTGSLPVDFLIKQSDVISQGKFSNELKFFWKRLVGQAKLYGEAKNAALAGGRYIPPEQQVGFVPPGNNKPPPPVQPNKALVQSVELSKVKLADLQRTVGLEGSALQLVQQQLATEKGIVEQRRLQAEYEKAQKLATDAGGRDAVKNQAADDSSLEGSFQFLRPEIQNQLTNKARQDIQAAQRAGIFRSDINTGITAKPEDLLSIAGSARGVLTATAEFQKAGGNLSDALDQLSSPLAALSEKDWTVVVNVTGDGLASVSGDAVLGG